MESLKDNVSPAHDVGLYRDREDPEAPSRLNAPRDHSARRIAQALARVIQSWRLIAGTSLGIGVATAVLVLLLPERYESEFSFVPQAAASVAAARPSLLGLAQG